MSLLLGGPSSECKRGPVLTAIGSGGGRESRASKAAIKDFWRQRDQLLPVEAPPAQSAGLAAVLPVNPRYSTGSQQARGFLSCKVSGWDIVDTLQKAWAADGYFTPVEERVVQLLQRFAEAEQAKLQQQQEEEADLVNCEGGCEGSEQSPDKPVAGSGLDSTRHIPTTRYTPRPFTPYPQQGEAPATVQVSGGGSSGTDEQQTVSPVRPPPTKRSRAAQRGRGGDQGEGAMPSQAAASVAQPAAVGQGAVAMPSSSSKALHFGAAVGTHPPVAAAEVSSGNTTAAATHLDFFLGRVIPDSEDEEGVELYMRGAAYRGGKQ